MQQGCSTMRGFAEYESYDALGLAALIKAGEVSATEVLEAAITRVEARNPAVNAVVTKLYDHAAQAIEAGLPDRPFTGVPYLVKALFTTVAGVRCAHGSRFCADLSPAREDSLQVARLMRARHGDLWRDELLRVRLEPHLRAPAPRPLAQSLGPGAHAGRLQRGCGRGCRGPQAADRPRLRRLWLDPRTGGLLRPDSACVGPGIATPWHPPSARRSPGSPSSTRCRSRCATMRHCSMRPTAPRRAIPIS